MGAEILKLCLRCPADDLGHDGGLHNSPGYYRERRSIRRVTVLFDKSMETHITPTCRISRIHEVVENVVGNNG